MESDVRNNDVAEEANEEDEQEEEDEEDEEEEDDEVGDAAEDEGDSDVRDSEDGDSANSNHFDEDIDAEHGEGVHAGNATSTEAVTANAADAAGVNIELSEAAAELTVPQPALQAQATLQDATLEALGEQTHVEVRAKNTVQQATVR